MDTTTPTAALTSRASFGLWHRIAVRYGDQDPLGHVNNAAMSVFLEDTRCQLLAPLFQRHHQPGLDMVLARLVIDFRRELNYPGVVAIGSRIDGLGTKSITLGHGVFDGDSEICAATAQVTLVFFDVRRRVSVVPPAGFRQELAEMAKQSNSD